MIEKNLIEKLLASYDLGSLESFDIIRGGFVNDNFKVRTSKGIYFLRHYRQFFNLEKATRLNNALVVLKKQGFPVAEPVFAKNGNSVVEIEGKAFSFSEYIAGDKYDFSEKKLVNAAKILARLHKFNPDDLHQSFSVVRVNFQEHYFVGKLWKNSDSILNRLSLKNDKTDLDKFLIEAIDNMRHHYSLFVKDLSSIRERENLSLVHGDFWFGQLIFHGDEVAALVDFDDVKLGIPEYDLIHGVSSFIGFPDREGFDLKKLRLFIGSYREIYGPLDIRQREVAAFFRISMLSRLNYFVEHWLFNQQRQEGITHAEGFLAKLDWIESHESEIIAEFTR